MSHKTSQCLDASVPSTSLPPHEISASHFCSISCPAKHIHITKFLTPCLDKMLKWYSYIVISLKYMRSKHALQRDCTILSYLGIFKMLNRHASSTWQRNHYSVKQILWLMVHLILDLSKVKPVYKRPMTENLKSGLYWQVVFIWRVTRTVYAIMRKHIHICAICNSMVCNIICQQF